MRYLIFLLLAQYGFAQTSNPITQTQGAGTTLTVITVDTLSDDRQQGVTLREAVEQSIPRIVRFKVGGRDRSYISTQHHQWAAYSGRVQCPHPDHHHRR